MCASPIRACHLAKYAFDEALAALVRVPEDAYRDSLMILQLLRDDLILWSSEISQQGACPSARPSGRACALTWGCIQTQTGTANARPDRPGTIVQ